MIPFVLLNANSLIFVGKDICFPLLMPSSAFCSLSGSLCILPHFAYKWCCCLWEQPLCVHTCGSSRGSLYQSRARIPTWRFNDVLQLNWALKWLTLWVMCAHIPIQHEAFGKSIILMFSRPLSSVILLAAGVAQVYLAARGMLAEFMVHMMWGDWVKPGL